MPLSDISREGQHSSRSSFSEGDKTGTYLLAGFDPTCSKRNKYKIRHRQCQYILYTTIAVQFVVLLVAVGYIWKGTDPTLAIWSPAKDTVSYHRLTSTPYFDNRSPYLGTDVQTVDALWEALYDDGLISVISESEASHLLNKTRAAPKTPDLYLVQLQVFHDLHCLNLIRKWVYMDLYPEMAEWSEDGTLNHDTMNAIHVDHCIDALRQSVMCTGDITPRKFAPHANERQYYVYPAIYTTQTCRNHDAIRNWAKERRVVDWMMSFDDEWARTRFNTSLP
ncbi:hypothetical protein LEL_10022 [Akanthomyces lecanii RCEF 1005]|uniref:Tat pathway signal sequence n=1 Tax=Akanthomyces lecanii RCEF 1005 TaxID=1081108 RepID=A0A162KHV5_CORDF|nr:hypothetical protein LEL_10022 [Akanthomyces lecanii RCEF 1005]